MRACSWLVDDGGKMTYFRPARLFFGGSYCRLKFCLRTGLVVKLTMVFFVFRYCLRCSKDLELVSWRRRSSGEGFATKIVPAVTFFYIEIEDGIRCRPRKCLHLDWVFFGYSGRRYISVNIPRLIYIAQVWVYGIVLATMFLKPSS